MKLLYRLSLFLVLSGIAVSTHAQDNSTQKIPKALGTITSPLTNSFSYDSLENKVTDRVASKQKIDPSTKPKINKKSTSSSFSRIKKANAQCDVTAYVTTGTLLLNQIRNQGYDCVGQLFDNASKDIKLGTFTEANFITVANEAKKEAINYDGVDASRYLQSLHYWIRAFYYYGPERNLSTAATRAATKEAIDALVANSHFYDKTEVNARVINFVWSNLNNAWIGEHYVSVAMNALDTFDKSYADIPIWEDTFRILYWIPLSQCQQKTECQTSEHNTALVTKVGNFIHDNVNWLDNKNLDHHLHNLGLLLAHFYNGIKESHFEALRPELENQLHRVFNTLGPAKSDTGRRAYLQALAGVNNRQKCQVYNICSKKQEIINQVLNNRINCPSGLLYMWAQDMTQAQLTWACSTLKKDETYFHDFFQTNNTPVTPDDNDTLRMVIFNDSREWKIYGYVLFGADVNTGGLYLEGDPSQAGDQATFFAYEYVAERPIFDIWNLHHEYVHYLDGRFIKKGDFEEVNDTKRTNWYTEGVADFISKKSCNPAAITEARKNTYPLSTIFQNEYGVGQTRIYQWGYLANRFMFEKHKNEYTAMQSLFKQGDYATYRSNLVDNWVTNKTFDAEFSTWLQTVQSSNCVIDTTRPPSPVEPINIDDIQGSDQVGVDACARGDQPTTTIRAGKAICIPDTQTGGNLVFDLSAPSGLVNVTLQITLRHGNGNPNLLHKAGGHPTSTNYDYSASNPGVEETILATPVQQGWNYIHAPAEATFSGVTLLARYIQNGQEVMPVMSSPTSGSTLAGTSQKFSWSNNGANVTEWKIHLGNSKGANNYHDSGSLGTANSSNITGLPSDGSTLYMRLWYKEGIWKYVDTTYIASSIVVDELKPLSPNGSIDTNHPIFTWTAKSTVTNNDLYLIWAADATGAQKVWNAVGATQAGCGSGSGTCSYMHPTAVFAEGAGGNWRVKDDGGNFSNTLYFTVDTGTTTVEELKPLSPSGSINTNQPTFTWTAKSTVTDNELYLVWAADATGAQKVWNAVSASQAGCPSGTGTCSYMLSTAIFAEGAGGNWRVKDDGGDFSDTLSFTVNSGN